MVGGVVAIELAAAAMDDQRRVLDPASSGAHVLADQRGPDRGDRGGVVAGEFGAGPVGELACSARDRLGENRLAGAGAKLSKSSRIAIAARLAGLGRKAEVPFGVVPDPRGHVDDHRAGEARRRPGRPAHARARSRRATSRRRSRLAGRAPRPARRRRPPSARRSGARRSAGEAPWPRRSMAMSRMIGGERRLAAEEAAMRHQPVQQHDRPPRALVAIGDPRAVRSGEMLQKPSPADAPLFGVLRPGAATASI